MPCRQPSRRETDLAGRQIAYELHRSSRRRKNISFVVQHQQLRVLAPKRTPLSHIEDILQHRSQWILERLDAPPPPRLSDQVRAGGVLTILGVRTAVAVGEGPSRLEDQRLIVNKSAEDLTDEAQRCLRVAARVAFQRLIDEWAPTINATPRRLQVRDQQTRWGSASSNGKISLNWRLIFAPPDVIEYVVVHELCHLREPSHRPVYWALVEQHLPDYRERRAWLKQHGDSLSW